MRRKRDSESLYSARRKKVLDVIKGEAALFPANPVAKSNRDQDYPYQPNTDFFYLTGFAEPESALVLTGAAKGPRSVLYLRDRNEEEERWVGDRLGLKRAKRRFRVDEVRDISALSGDLPQLISGARVLHFAPGVNPRIDRQVWRLLQTTAGPRVDFPNVMKDSRLITSEMRFIKDRDEIRTLKHVVDLSAHAFLELIPQLRFMKSEVHAARTLESYFAEFGASEVAFNTIVASGKNATVLHHIPRFHPLWKKELVLIDAGARFRGYCADITRTLPVSGKFTAPQAAIYDVVLAAQNAGLKQAKRDGTLSGIHQAVVDEITRGLVGLKILRGKVSSLVEQGKYKPFYMHRSGHWLGLDVHDISPLSVKKTGEIEHSRDRALVPGNVFTLEPGLYFAAHDESVPAQYRGIGVRIEDDILITENGAEVLSERVPVDRKDLESLME